MRLAAGATNHVTDGLILNGESNAFLKLRPIVGGSRWYFDVDPTVTPDIESIDVRYSDASPGITLTAINSSNSRSSSIDATAVDRLRTMRSARRRMCAFS